MSNLINDWAPETRALLKALTDAGFTLLSGDNGEERFKFNPDQPLDAFIAELTATDEARLFISKDGKKLWLSLVYGNSPGELVADYPHNEAEAYKALDRVAEAHYEAWSGKRQPTKPSPYASGGAQ